ncbi:MAG TPA: hypothetical protein VJR92_07050 [Gemmatimonadaceae bacterium]|nr:hypothetical protein [Gemmatimonadaceae bacterium]
MYSVCIFCTKPLGTNESLEAFPVGTRIAFDAARGRLWVVCRSCERWNLSPLDERWEAVEQAERAYRDTRTRVATENIGLAKLRDGTTLVRIGEPLRPEFAAWRYGDQFGRRRTRALLVAGAGIAAVAGVTIGGIAAGIGMGAFGGMFYNGGRALIGGDPERVVAKIRGTDGRAMRVRRRHLGETFLHRIDEELALRVRFIDGEAQLTGREAARVAAILIPKVNRYGGNRQMVADAVREIEASGGPDALVSRLADAGPAFMEPLKVTRRSRWNGFRGFDKHGLYGLTRPQRLALEMSLHEEAERRALQGELQELERAWRDAEEIAGISDNMFVPQSVEERVKELKGASSK